jgi:hypothetical protein
MACLKPTLQILGVQGVGRCFRTWLSHFGLDGTRLHCILLKRNLDMAEATEITSGALIAATKVKGTNVYNPAGEKLGSVEDIMVAQFTPSCRLAASSAWQRSTIRCLGRR